MQDNKLDKETQEVLTDSEELSIGVKGTFWKLIRQKLIDKVISLSDILEFDTKDPVQVAHQLSVNKEVISILLAWLNDIEGIAKSNAELQSSFRQEKKDTYIKQLE